jgi:hypothetical protein
LRMKLRHVAEHGLETLAPEMEHTNDHPERMWASESARRRIKV